MTKINPENGETYFRGIRKQTVRFGTLSREIAVPGWYPLDPDDPEGLLIGAELKEWDEVFNELRAEYAARIRRIRKKLKLTQEEAGRIIGGGKRAFQKYESGKVPPSDAAIGLLEILDRHPEEVETLRALRG